MKTYRMTFGIRIRGASVPLSFTDLVAGRTEAEAALLFRAKHRSYEVRELQYCTEVS